MLFRHLPVSPFLPHLEVAAACRGHSDPSLAKRPVASLKPVEGHNYANTPYTGRMSEQAKTLAIVGGGAAGLAAAIAAGRVARDAGMPLAITVFERDDRVGRTILATGNGRCNFTNERILWGYYHNGAFVRDVLAALDKLTYGNEIPEAGFSPASDFFEDLGLVWRQESEGRRYPQANKASVVVDVLRAAAANVGAREACNSAVSSIEPPREQGKPFTLRMKDGRFERADAVIVACGGRALSNLGLDAIDGLRLEPQRPVLGPLRVTDECIPWVRELDNIRVRCTTMLLRPQGNDLNCVGSERGEVMFRKYGLSGICVFNLSRIAQPGDEVAIDLLDMGNPDYAYDYLERRARDLKASFARALTYEDMLRGLVLPRVADVLFKREGISPSDPFAGTREQLDDLAHALTFFSFTVAGMGDETMCQVRRGGLSVDCFDANTMVSKAVPGFYAVGEALDVDGPCGGYNLHWAWSTDILAGKSATAALLGY